MPLRLYMIEDCPAGHRAAIALDEKKLEHETIFFRKGKRPKALEALGPRAKSPTLIDGAARVYDSPVVLEYLEDRYPKRRLMPKSPEARAEVRMLVKRFEEDLMPKMYAVMKDSGNGSARKALEQELATWEASFAGKKFAVGDDVTDADIMIFTMFPLLEKYASFELGTDLPSLRAWLARMKARPTTKVPRPVKADVRWPRDARHRRQVRSEGRARRRRNGNRLRRGANR